MNVLLFLSHIVHNDHLKDFIQSYLVHRAKSYSLSTSAYDDILRRLDRAVFLIFLRLSSPTAEHRLLPAFYPESLLTVVPSKSSSSLKTSSSRPSDVDPFREIDAQYGEFVSSLDILQFPYLLDLVSILSEANRDKSGLLLRGLVRIKGSGVRREVGEAVTESYQATTQLVEASVRLFHSVLDKKHGSLSTVQQHKPVTSDTNSNSKPVESPCEQLYFLAAFAVDISFSYKAWLEAATCGSGEEEQSPMAVLFSSSGTSLSVQYGSVLLDALKLIYEVVLPLCQKILKFLQLDSLTTETTESTDINTSRSDQNLAAVDHFLVVIQDSAVCALDVLLSHSIQACNSISDQQFTSPLLKRGVSNNSEASGGDGGESELPLESVSWIDVLQAKLDVAAILHKLHTDRQLYTTSSVHNNHTSKVLFGASSTHTQGEASIEESNVMVGVLVSDFIKYSGRVNGGTSSVHTMLLTLLGGADVSRADYVLSSLTLGEESLLPVDTRGAATSGSSSSSDSASGSGASYMSHFPSLSGGGDKANCSSSSSCPTTNHTDALLEAYDAIRGIFPDLGEGFIEACLAVYSNNTEQVIDALLMDNLHPRLLLLDRKLSKMSQGKSGTDDIAQKYGASTSKGGRNNTSINSSSSSAASVIASRESARQEASFKDKLKARVAEEDKQREYEAYLIEKENFVPTADSYIYGVDGAESEGDGIDYSQEQALASRDVLASEYNDDYDDQYDDFIPSSKQATAFKKHPLAASYNEVYSDNDDDNEGVQRQSVGGRSGGKLQLPAGGDARKGGAHGAHEKAVHAPVTNSGGGGRNQQQNHKSAVNADYSDLAASAPVFTPSSGGVPAADTTSHALSAAAQKRKEKKVQQPKKSAYTEEDRAETLRQMTETRRFNSLVKDDEGEAAFWEGMKNTNRSSAVNSGGGKDSWKRELQQREEEEANSHVDAPTAQFNRLTVNSRAGQLGGRPGQRGPIETVTSASFTSNSATASGGAARHSSSAGGVSSSAGSRQPNSSSSAGNSGGGGGSGPKPSTAPHKEKSDRPATAGSGGAEGAADGAKKPQHRQKTFDKHHQKDKANRKFGTTFTPAV